MTLFKRTISPKFTAPTILLTGLALFGTATIPLIGTMAKAETIAPLQLDPLLAGNIDIPSSEYASSDLPLVFNASRDGFDGHGRPASRSSGGSRGNCPTLLIALVPGEGTLANDDCGQLSQAFTALTTTPAPTLWFYIPDHDSPLEAEFALLDDNRQAIVVETPTIPSTSGIVGIPLAYELETDQSYRWILSLSQNTNPSRELIVEGIVRRVPLNAELSQQLEAVTDSRDRILSLAQAGIWHDALSELVTLRQQQPENTALIDDWQQFLGSVGLGAIADAPIVNGPIADASTAE